MYSEYPRISPLGAPGGSQDIIIELRSSERALMFDGGPGTKIHNVPQCLKITEKVSFNNASEAMLTF